jgi:hypothetical protein
MVTSMLRYAATRANAAQHGAFPNLIQPLRRRCGAARAAHVRLFGRGGPSGCVTVRLHRSHLLQDTLDLRRSQHVLVWPQKVGALVRNRLFQVGHDLRLVGIVLELTLCTFQIGTQALKTRLLEMESVTVEIDDDDGVHVWRPNWLIVVLR